MKTQSGRMLLVAFVSMALTACLAEQAQAAGFVSVSPMKRGRNYHTATLLPNGKALVAGGAQPQSATSAELYDPKTDKWTDTGAMRAGHAFHTATLLHNGKVLVASGTTAELYDPASETWSRTGPMRHARSGHTATLLPNGKVLVTGGGGGEKAASAELYDPGAETWTVVGPIDDSLFGPAALLPNGKVLVAWLISGAGAGLYAPATKTWTTTSAPSSSRYYTAKLLLDGKVLVAGGNRMTAAELYDPASGTWSPAGVLNVHRDFCTATFLRNGQVMLAGGVEQGPDIPLYSAELYDPPTQTWTEIPMNEARLSHAATLLADGRVLVTGGVGWEFSLLSSAEIYEPDTNGVTPSITVLYNTNQIFSFAWTGIGKLEQSNTLSPPTWEPAPIQDNPQVISTSDSMKFFRIKAD